MKKWCVLFLMSFLIISNSFGKNYKQYSFKINGTINTDTGTISLSFFSEYIPNKVKVLDAKIKNNKFCFSGYIPEAQSVMFEIDGGYFSSYFILDKGVQDISINIDSIRVVPTVKNNIMLSDYPRYQLFNKYIDQKYNNIYHRKDSLSEIYNNNLPQDIKIGLNNEMKDLYQQSDRSLYEYSKKHPSSPYAFWRLVELMNWGYEPIWDSVYLAFSGELRNSYAGKVLKKKIDTGKQLTVGKHFPTILCMDKENIKFTGALFQTQKYTLVDFWYSKCGVCKAQFNKLKEIYDNFSDNGFEIIGISVDKESDKKLWEKNIERYKLNWMQYWDINGKSSINLSIGVFPTNYLIDSTGKIIEKNISPESLEKFLLDNLK